MGCSVSCSVIATEQVAQCADCNQLLAAMLSLCAVCQSEPTPSAMPDLTVSLMMIPSADTMLSAL